MNGLKFKDSDKEKVIDFLNFVSNNAIFNLDTKKCIQYYNMLSYMQKELIPKIDANVLEIEKINKNKSELKGK